MLVPMSKERFVQRMMFDALKAEEERVTKGTLWGYIAEQKTRRLKRKAKSTLPGRHR